MTSVSITTFEFFPAELFAEICRYLNGSDIHKAFYGINHRLSSLVLTYGIQYINLTEVQLIESRKILSDINCCEINTLIVSNKYNDEQIDKIFHQDYFSLSNFDNLQSLILDSIGLFSLNSIIYQDFNLQHLHSLIIRFRFGLCNEKLLYMYKVLLYEFSSRFQSLKYLNLSILDIDEPIPDNDILYPMESIETKSSLKYLSIENICINHAKSFFSYFSNLYKLNAIIELDPLGCNYSLLSNLTYCTLDIYSFSFPSLIDLLKQCPNLKQLIILTDVAHWSLLDDFQSDEFLEIYLLNVKHFRLEITNRYKSLNTLEYAWFEERLVEQFWAERKTTLNIINEKSIDDQSTEPKLVMEFSI